MENICRDILPNIFSNLDALSLMFLHCTNKKFRDAVREYVSKSEPTVESLHISCILMSTEEDRENVQQVLKRPLEMFDPVLTQKTFDITSMHFPELVMSVKNLIVTYYTPLILQRKVCISEIIDKIPIIAFIYIIPAHQVVKAINIVAKKKYRKIYHGLISEVIQREDVDIYFFDGVKRSREYIEILRDVLITSPAAHSFFLDRISSASLITVYSDVLWSYGFLDCNKLRCPDFLLYLSAYELRELDDLFQTIYDSVRTMGAGYVVSPTYLAVIQKYKDLDWRMEEIHILTKKKE